MSGETKLILIIGGGLILSIVKFYVFLESFSSPQTNNNYLKLSDLFARVQLSLKLCGWGWKFSENIERQNGQTKWSFWGLFWYSIDGIIAFSTWPLKLISTIGIFLSFVSVIALIVVFVRASTFGDPVAGWPSLVCIVLFMGGLIMTSLGILGLYFEKAYLEVKNRPIYVMSSTSLK